MPGRKQIASLRKSVAEPVALTKHDNVSDPNAPAFDEDDAMHAPGDESLDNVNAVDPVNAKQRNPNTRAVHASDVNTFQGYPVASSKDVDDATDVSVDINVPVGSPGIVRRFIGHSADAPHASALGTDSGNAADSCLQQHRAPPETVESNAHTAPDIGASRAQQDHEGYEASRLAVGLAERIHFFHFCFFHQTPVCQCMRVCISVRLRPKLHLPVFTNIRGYAWVCACVRVYVCVYVCVCVCALLMCAHSLIFINVHLNDTVDVITVTDKINN